MSRHRGMPEMRILAVVVVAATALSAFAKIADEVVEGETRAVDTTILLALRSSTDASQPLGGPWLQGVARDVTALGSGTALTLLVAMVVAFMLLAHRHRLALFTLAATAGGALLSALLKGVFDRPRPDLVPHGAYVDTSSFPSGHAMMSTVVYLTLAALVARQIDDIRLKVYAMAVAVVLTILVGISRVYLAVHWPTDVLAGWAAGAAWALGCWIVAQFLDLGARDRS